MAAEAGAAAALRYWRRIGGLLKAVDGGLLGDWVEWSQLGGNDSAAGVTRASDVFEWAQPLKAPASPANATAVWCALAPRGCDVSRHPSCGGVSALRASLVKVLGSSCDLASAFERLRKRLAASGGDVPPSPPPPPPEPILDHAPWESAAMADDAISSTAAAAWGALAVEIPVLGMAFGLGRAAWNRYVARLAAPPHEALLVQELSLRTCTSTPAS